MFFLWVTSYPQVVKWLAKLATPAFSRMAFLMPSTNLEGATVVVSLRNCLTLPCNKRVIDMALTYLSIHLIQTGMPSSAPAQAQLKAELAPTCLNIFVMF